MSYALNDMSNVLLCSSNHAKVSVPPVGKSLTASARESRVEKCGDFAPPRPQGITISIDDDGNIDINDNGNISIIINMHIYIYIYIHGCVCIYIYIYIYMYSYIRRSK